VKKEEEELRTYKFCARSQQNESTGKREKDLRQVQSDPSPRGGPGDLRQPEAQAAAGMRQL
jgi:hypothetical protein